jgi:hypothetical protein
MSCHRFGDAQGPDKNVGCQIAADADANAPDFDQAGDAALEHADAAAGADAKLGQAMHPRGFAANLGDLTTFTGCQEFEREESVRGHWQESQRPY